MRFSIASHEQKLHNTCFLALPFTLFSHCTTPLCHCAIFDLNVYSLAFAFRICYSASFRPALLHTSCLSSIFTLASFTFQFSVFSFLSALLPCHQTEVQTGVCTRTWRQVFFALVQCAFVLHFMK